MDGPPNTLGKVTEAGPRRLSNVCFHSYGLWKSRNTATVRVPEVKSSGEVQRQRNSIKEIWGMMELYLLTVVVVSQVSHIA